MHFRFCLPSSIAILAVVLGTISTVFAEPAPAYTPEQLRVLLAGAKTMGVSTEPLELAHESILRAENARNKVEERELAHNAESVVMQTFALGRSSEKEATYDEVTSLVEDARRLGFVTSVVYEGIAFDFRVSNLFSTGKRKTLALLKEFAQLAKQYSKGELSVELTTMMPSRRFARWLDLLSTWGLDRRRVHVSVPKGNLWRDSDQVVIVFRGYRYVQSPATENK